MTLVQLRHLISLAESGSFSKSAQALHLTQPALSRSIRALEDELGMPLFDRVGRRNELTAFGREVLDRARAAGVRGRRAARQRPADARRAGRRDPHRHGLGPRRDADDAAC